MEPARAPYRDHVQRAVEAIRAALAREGYDRLVVHSGALQPKNPFDDQDWPFDPVPTFRYLAPMSWPDCVVVIEARDVPPTLYALESDSFWERRSEPDWSLLEAALDVKRVTSLEAMHSISWDGAGAFIGNGPREGISTPTMTVNPTEIVEALHELRTVKSDWEIACMEQASLRAARGHLRAAQRFDAGERSELAIHLSYLDASEQDDADCPYKNIVALGENGATLHHIEYRHMPDAASLLIDAGGRHLGYCADITRTHVAPDAGPDAARFASLVDAVEQLQLRVIGRVEPGLSYESLHDFAHQEMAQLLVDAELVSCSPETAVETGLTRTFFPHGLGHHLGVQVHDVAGLPHKPRPENRFLRNTRTIEAGQVFTIEPGLYFIGGLLAPLRAQPDGASVVWETVDALRRFGGIRIEDNILVLPEGSEPRVRNLTREAFARAES